MDAMEQRAFELWVLRNYGDETTQIWVQHNFDALYAAYQNDARVKNEPPPSRNVVIDRYEEI